MVARSLQNKNFTFIKNKDMVMKKGKIPAGIRALKAPSKLSRIVHRGWSKIQSLAILGGTK